MQPPRDPAGRRRAQFGDDVQCPPAGAVLEPTDVAAWLDTDLTWVMRAIAEEGMPVLGYRSDGLPLLAADGIRAWLRRPTVHDDET
ncbi:MAG TPA: hypothetical protein VKB25_09940 [Conexibacter sp.]|nr:hypothetical protein [Conexibacter sp.]